MIGMDSLMITTVVLMITLNFFMIAMLIQMIDMDPLMIATVVRMIATAIQMIGTDSLMFYYGRSDDGFGLSCDYQVRSYDCYGLSDHCNGTF
jgi:hypothetical protein